ncbi:hypothetical protein MLD38_032658 [Melastoma candidum]|uniref:Uncharacterized protein n=1 Tax=Melastoma candidum TaxID=119954 RepID=A0ACB9M4V6_9MYRT|nr:hypothetical protein MLD38_032658 [Melastoma candidum]
MSMAAVIHGNPLLPAVGPPYPSPSPSPSSFPLSFRTHHSSISTVPASGPTPAPDALARDRFPISHKDTRSYTAAISSLGKSGRGADAAAVFLEMLHSGVEPSAYTFVAVLTASSRMNDLGLGSQLHGMAIKSGLLGSVFVGNAVMGMYGNCGAIGSVFKVFDEMPEIDVASLNTVLTSLVREGMLGKAFKVLRSVVGRECFGVKADWLTVSMILSACADCGDRNKGREIHGYAVRSGIEGNLSVGNALIGFYTKCGRVVDVENLFHGMTNRDVITYTAVMRSYLEFGLVDAALEMYHEMPEKNVISRNVLLSGLCRNGEGLKVMDLFVQMIDDGVELSDHSLTSIAMACGLLEQEKLSEQVQGFVLKFGHTANAHTDAAVIDMFVRSGRMRDAIKMYARWPSEWERDSSIICTSIICGYARVGRPEEAMSTFSRFHSEGRVVLDEVASTSLLGVCGTLGFIEMGEQIHCHVVKTGLKSHLEVGNTLVSMYYKCWNMRDAVKVFSDMATHDVVSWNALIAGHLLHRQGDEALDAWTRFRKSGIRPDETTVLLVILAYRFTGSCLVDECRRFFSSMKRCYNVEPSLEHYTALISVLGFWGFLDLAEKLIKGFPFASEASLWRALLDGCRIHSNTAIAKRAIKHLLSLEPEDAQTYALVSNLYSASGRWHCSEEVRDEMRSKGLRKWPSRSWLIHDNEVVTFYTRDRSHPQTKDIYSGLDILILECLKTGYDPDTSFVLHEVEEHQKKEFLFYHSAKLAAAFGLLMTKPGKPIRITKNILLCGDCHQFLKHATRVTNREFSVRDTSGIHRFSNGRCSCNDQW